MHLIFVVVLAISSRILAQAAKVAVTGVQTGVNPNTGARPARMNINDLYIKGGPAWDLYIQALLDFQAVDEADELSYFKIMGIHGLPYEAYNGVEQVPGGSRSGYCPHNELLFGTWHRPYVALYEQILAKHVREIAQRYTGEQSVSYLSAAQNFRVAYWDWAQDTRLPTVVTLATVNINGPTGMTSVRNPFHSYRFQNFPFTIPYMNSGTLSHDIETKRCPNSHGVDNITWVNGNLSLPSADLKDSVYKAFTAVQAFQNMESAKFPGYDFENPHNTVHNSVGCRNGHMYDLNWSAFDPIFMLHHANVDRLIAMWQAIYYNQSMFNITSECSATFAMPRGEVNASSPLKPFFNNNGDFHTSTSITNIKTFGYTYPEIDDWSLSPEALSTYVRTQVNRLYSTGRGASKRSARYQYRSPPVFKDYSILIKVNRSEIALPASIDLFLDNRSAGKMVLLSMPMEGISYATIPLDRALEVANKSVKGPSIVMPYLNNSLRIEITQGDGTTIPVESIPSLEIDAQAQDFVPRTEDCEFPAYGATTRRPIVTRKAIIRLNVSADYVV